MTAKAKKPAAKKKPATAKKKPAKAAPVKKAPAKGTTRPERTRKKPAPAKPRSKKATSKSDNPTAEDALKKGNLAKINLYQNYAKRISAGEILKPSELRFFRQLEGELYKESESDNGDDPGSSKDPVPDRFENRNEALEYLGISKRSLSYHLGKNIKQNPDGTFDKAECDRFLASRSEGKGAGSGRNETAQDYKNTLAAKIQRAELRWRIARARREENLNAELEGRLVSRKEVAEAWADRVRIVSSGLETLADRLPPILEGRAREEMRELIRDEIRRLREAYAADGKYCPEPET